MFCRIFIWGRIKQILNISKFDDSQGCLAEAASGPREIHRGGLHLQTQSVRGILCPHFFQDWKHFGVRAFSQGPGVTVKAALNNFFPRWMSDYV